MLEARSSTAISDLFLFKYAQKVNNKVPAPPSKPSNGKSDVRILVNKYVPYDLNPLGITKEQRGKNTESQSKIVKPLHC